MTVSLSPYSMLLDGYESDDFGVLASPDSLFSVLSDVSCDTLVASDDELWEGVTDKEFLDEAADGVVAEGLVLGADDASTDHVGPINESHLIARLWAPEFTAAGEEEKTIYTALYAQVSPYDHGADLEAWDDGLFVEPEDDLPDWRASCSPLSSTAPVSSHSRPIDTSFVIAKGDPQSHPPSIINDTVDTPLCLQVTGKRDPPGDHG